VKMDSTLERLTELKEKGFGRWVQQSGEKSYLCDRALTWVKLGWEIARLALRGEALGGSG